MIDYEKLKLAHELAKNINQPIGIEVEFSKKVGVRYILCIGCNDDDSHFNAFENIDALISKLMNHRGYTFSHQDNLSDPRDLVWHDGC